MREVVLEAMGFKLVIERLRTRSRLLLCCRGAGHKGRARARVAPPGQGEVLEGPQVFQAMAEAMRDMARAVHDEVPPPPPPAPLGREITVALLLAEKRLLMREF